MALPTDVIARVDQLVKDAVATALSRLQSLPEDADAFDKLAAVTGLSREEVKWTAQRIHELQRSGLTARETAIRVRNEAKSRPWLQ